MNDTETNLVIRPARDADVPRMREIAVQAWAPVYSDFRERMGEELYRLECPRTGVLIKPIRSPISIESTPIGAW